MADTGNTATLTFSSGFTATFIEIDPGEETLEKLADDDLGTSTYKTYVPNDLKEPGEITGRLYFDAEATPPTMNGTAVTATLTYPQKAGGSTRATLVGTGFFTRWKRPMAVNGQLMVTEITFAFDGKTTDPTFTAGT